MLSLMRMRAFALGLLVVGTAGACVGEAVAAPAASTCSAATPLLIEPQTQGTAGQAVAFVSVVNYGSECRVDAVATLTVTEAGQRVRSIVGNSVREKVHGTIQHGVTALFDVWWSNWCGKEREFRAVATFGSGSASGPYHVLPECLTRTSASRLKPVVQSPVAAP